MTTRKILLTISVLLCLITQGISQDVIIKRNGTEIQTKIIQITDDFIKYKDYSFLDGPLRSLYISEVFMVVYENGQRERFDQITEVEKQPQKESQKTQTNELYEYRENNTVSSKNESHFALGIGYGNSYGGVGTKVQFIQELGGDFSIGIQASIGTILDINSDEINSILSYSGGILIYPFKSFYLNLQYGGFGIYYKANYDFDSGSLSFSPELLYGPSVLVGYELFLSEHFGLNLGAGGCYDLNGGNQYYYAYDVGMIFRF